MISFALSRTRDSAIAIKALVDDFLANETPKVEEQIRIYIDAQAMIQNITTPSGSTCDGGLGETRFQVNMTATNDDWPRPQRDGPALRVTALVAYGRYLLDTKQEHAAKTKIWPIVQNDLAYVSENWNKSTYDLWESIESSSMFATAVSEFMSAAPPFSPRDDIPFTHTFLLLCRSNTALWWKAMVSPRRLERNARTASRRHHKYCASSSHTGTAST